MGSYAIRERGFIQSVIERAKKDNFVIKSCLQCETLAYLFDFTTICDIASLKENIYSNVYHVSERQKVPQCCVLSLVRPNSCEVFRVSCVAFCMRGIYLNSKVFERVSVFWGLQNISCLLLAD